MKENEDFAYILPPYSEGSFLYVPGYDHEFPRETNAVEQGESRSTESIFHAPSVLQRELHYLWVILFSPHSCYWDPSNTNPALQCLCCGWRPFNEQAAVFTWILVEYVVISLLEVKVILFKMLYNPGLLQRRWPVGSVVHICSTKKFWM